ncbi:PTS cellobiose transporter subunit IIA [Leuconostoc gelidum subsp. gasicomitatum]|uniref:PTS cellobiose transporter subunit IIA n=1 Tax=Leuconostoc gasicomitatum TaxID=115778 RepID=UPI001CC51BB3|nr:PTS cellobiose transporter subunit IIA [Leuconostoc gasicomitatum]MBZ5952676.1 PTS cellobiose transporter subunit IIA [Leuconostoc gasicomitatum]
MNSEEIQVIAFEIILHSGNSRTNVHEAFSAMRLKNFKLSEQKLQGANTELLLAHKSQTKLLQTYAAGTKIDMEIILVHAQDHLMTTMTLREMAIEMQHLYKEVKQIEGSSQSTTRESPVER